MIYIKLDKIIEFDFELDDNYLKGSSYADSLQDMWVPLTEDQQAFYKSNPTASAKEVFDMKLNEVTPPTVINAIEDVRKMKLQEIADQDKRSNNFYVSVTKGGVEIANSSFWLDQGLRSSLLNLTLPSLKADGQTTTKLWNNATPPASIDVPIDWAMAKIPLVEIYAKRTYDLRQSNEAKVYAASTVETINSIDVTADFPIMLTFELNLDL